MFLKLTILACLAISSAIAEPNLEHAQLSYGSHLLGGINPELYISTKALSPLQYTSSFPAVYATQLLAGPAHKAVKPIVSAPLQYAATLPRPLRFRTLRHHFTTNHTLRTQPLLFTPPWPMVPAEPPPPPPLAVSVTHQPQQPSITPLLPPTHKHSEVVATPRKHWTPFWDDLPPSSTVEAFRLRTRPRRRRPPVPPVVPRVRKQRAKSPYNFLRVIIRQRPWPKHALKLGRIVSRIRWLEQYLVHKRHP
ncbi:WAS/WASL-interacting protein family member 3-like [Malaya genurostris]|uniref:WAS/WASL-interacting protein family member 3-like n=1 Tax=Malaya genurostris TaxID=325434 RepID=UPI0026F3F11A|nr:WAS/WASL-interacting protein family member 3-like [Malaya genurostris]